MKNITKRFILLFFAVCLWSLNLQTPLQSSNDFRQLGQEEDDNGRRQSQSSSSQEDEGETAQASSRSWAGKSYDNISFVITWPFKTLWWIVTYPFSSSLEEDSEEDEDSSANGDGILSPDSTYYKRKTFCRTLKEGQAKLYKSPTGLEYWLKKESGKILSSEHQNGPWKQEKNESDSDDSE